MKKQINIALIIIVAGLWATVLYKYVSQYLVKKEFATVQKEYTTAIDAKIRQKDTFQLAALSRDPFLNKVFNNAPVKRPTFRKIMPSQPKKEVKPKIQIPFPQINYYGYIKSTDKKDELVLLKVNEKLMKLRMNQTMEGLKVTKIYKDSIQVSFNKVIRYLKKQ